MNGTKTLKRLEDERDEVLKRLDDKRVWRKKRQRTVRALNITYAVILMVVLVALVGTVFSAGLLVAGVPLGSLVVCWVAFRVGHTMLMQGVKDVRQQELQLQSDLVVAIESVQERETLRLLDPKAFDVIQVEACETEKSSQVLHTIDSCAQPAWVNREIERSQKHKKDYESGALWYAGQRIAWRETQDKDRRRRIEVQARHASNVINYEMLYKAQEDETLQELNARVRRMDGKEKS